MPETHSYDLTITWDGNLGTGNQGRHSMDHRVASEATVVLDGSCDPAFGGDPSRWNPEQLLVAALSQCHLLAYLGAARQAGVTVLAYRDEADGEMELRPEGGGAFTHAVLRPQVVISDDSDPAAANAAHDAAHRGCFIASSVNFPVTHEPTAVRESEAR